MSGIPAAPTSYHVNMNKEPSSGVTAPSKAKVHKGWWLLALVLVVGLIVKPSPFVVLPSPFGPPATLHVWGKDFNSTGDPYCDVTSGPLCFDYLFAPVGPSPAPPITAQAMQQDAAHVGMTPVVLHLQPGILGWLFGMTDAGPKPSQHTEPIYLQVGPDAFIAYLWARCCMPDW
jgi:hypothetical protein